MPEHRRSLLSALFACACAAAPAQRAEPACPERDGASPLLPPGAARVPGRGMATTINPGANISEEQFRVEGMSRREVEEFYRRGCLARGDEPATFTEPAHGAGAGAGATRSYRVSEEEGAPFVRVRCERCY